MQIYLKLTIIVRLFVCLWMHEKQVQLDFDGFVSVNAGVMSVDEVETLCNSSIDNYPNISINNSDTPKSISELMRLSRESGDTSLNGIVRLSFHKFIVSNDNNDTHPPLVRLACPTKTCGTSIQTRELNPKNNKKEYKCKRNHYCSLPTPLYWFKAEFIDEIENDNDQKYVTVFVTDSAAKILLKQSASWYVDKTNKSKIQQCEDDINKSPIKYKVVISNEYNNNAIINAFDTEY